MDKENSKLRVAVASPLPVTAAGLATLLQADSGLEVTLASAGPRQWPALLRDQEADVLVVDVDEHDSTDQPFFSFLERFAGILPVLALVAQPTAAWLVRALRAGVRGVLLRGSSAEELTAAVRLCAAGAVALSPEAVTAMLGPASYAPEEADGVVEPLTPREREVLFMLAEGLLNKEIAGRLHISEHTVKFHISSIMGKLGVSSRTEAVTRGIRLGWVVL